MDTSRDNSLLIPLGMTSQRLTSSGLAGGTPKRPPSSRDEHSPDFLAPMVTISSKYIKIDQVAEVAIQQA